MFSQNGWQSHGSGVWVFLGGLVVAFPFNRLVGGQRGGVHP